jgi:hypothetical protein
MLVFILDYKCVAVITSLLFTVELQLAEIRHSIMFSESMHPLDMEGRAQGGRDSVVTWDSMSALLQLCLLMPL